MNGKAIPVNVPVGIIVRDALDQLIGLGELEPLLREEHYLVSFKETGEHLDIAKTLIKNGVKDGDYLRILEIKAG